MVGEQSVRTRGPQPSGLAGQSMGLLQRLLNPTEYARQGQGYYMPPEVVGYGDQIPGHDINLDESKYNAVPPWLQSRTRFEDNDSRIMDHMAGQIRGNENITVPSRPGPVLGEAFGIPRGSEVMPPEELLKMIQGMLGQ